MHLLHWRSTEIQLRFFNYNQFNLRHFRMFFLSSTVENRCQIILGFFSHFCFENNFHSQRYVTLIIIKWAIIAFIFVFHSHLLKSSNEIFFGMKLLFIECDSALKCLKTFRMESKSSNECAIFSTVTLYAKRKCTIFLTNNKSKCVYSL